MRNIVRLQKAVTTIVLGLCLGNIAVAADMPFKAPARAAAYSWTGWYAGVNLGYGWGDSNVRLSPNDPSSTGLNTLFAPQAASFDRSGGLGGVQLGYNWQFSRNWLVGAETDFNFSNIKGSGEANSALATFGIPTSTHGDERVKWFGTVRGRLGYLPMDNLLIYATAGLAYGRVEQSASFNNNSATLLINNLPGFSAVCAPFSPCLSGAAAHTAGGWTAGGGFELAFGPSVTFKAEYLYVNLDANSFLVTARNHTAGLTPASFTAQFDSTNVHVARAGLNYRF